MSEAFYTKRVRKKSVVMGERSERPSVGHLGATPKPPNRSPEPRVPSARCSGVHFANALFDKPNDSRPIQLTPNSPETKKCDKNYQKAPRRAGRSKIPGLYRPTTGVRLGFTGGYLALLWRQWWLGRLRFWFDFRGRWLQHHRNRRPSLNVGLRLLR